MDGIALSLAALGGLVGFGWLAARAGVDSRDWPISEEERLARFGLVWDDPAASGSEPLVEQARFRRLDLQREAAAERLLHLARQARAAQSTGSHTGADRRERAGRVAVEAAGGQLGAVGGGAQPIRSARAKLATALVRLAARVDRVAALDGAARQYLNHTPANCRAPASQRL